MNHSAVKFTPAWRTLVLTAGIAVAISSVAVIPARKASTELAETLERDSRPSDSGSGEHGDSIREVRQGRTHARVKTSSRASPACAAGRNGGATDVGVTGTSIKLGATVVDSGIGASFLRDARFGMLAVKNRVNRAGGICGRQLDLVLVDDEWSYQRGGEFIRNLVEQERVFALAVVPSSEGLKNVSDAGYLRKQRIPVIGSDGMLIHQYLDPYIWPVAASTMSTMHVLAKHARDVFKARDYGIVYESTYHFGIEGAYAFNAAVRRLTKKDVNGYSNPLTAPKCSGRFCGIAAGAASYSTEIKTFNDSCRDCDFVALLLEPATALAWIKGGAFTPAEGPSSNFRMGGVQPLFTRSFAQECGPACHKIWLWTGYVPPIGGNLGRSEIAEYVADLRATRASADYNNTFAQGAYAGMVLLVEALHQVGPDLTRARLVRTMDSMDFNSGLTGPLAWRSGNHFANVSMRAYSIQYKDRFAGWRDERTVVKDPWVGRDIP